MLQGPLVGTNYHTVTASGLYLAKYNDLTGDYSLSYSAPTHTVRPRYWHMPDHSDQLIELATQHSKAEKHSSDTASRRIITVQWNLAGGNIKQAYSASSTAHHSSDTVTHSTTNVWDYIPNEQKTFAQHLHNSKNVFCLLDRIVLCTSSRWTHWNIDPSVHFQFLFPLCITRHKITIYVIWVTIPDFNEYPFIFLTWCHFLQGAALIEV